MGPLGAPFGPVLQKPVVLKARPDFNTSDRELLINRNRPDLLKTDRGTRNQHFRQRTVDQHFRQGTVDINTTI
jgi:hypothetical protein